ncbi:MAG: choice-of-anchor tandem repeat GloVer-containing protein [Caulobacteraceae bacterium]
MSRIQQVFGKTLVGAALAVSVAVPLGAAGAPQPRDVFYNFTGSPGGFAPDGRLIRDAAGNFYGVTFYGGGGTCYHGCGVVFKLSPLGVPTTLYTFTGGSDGRGPIGGVVADAAGNLYGTAAGDAYNPGVVFKLTPGGQETVLHAFAGGGDGEIPSRGLIVDAAGNLFGTTGLGGAFNRGIVFKLAPDGTETILHSFYMYGSGGGVIMDRQGNLYGTVYGSLSDENPGAIFKITSNGVFSVLYTFTGGADGRHPIGSLFMDGQGALYGTTKKGGGSKGVAFKLAPDGTETVLHRFTGTPLDGALPDGGLIMDKQGNLFGTTSSGGPFHLGTVFQISPDGTETLLHSFAGNNDTPPDGEVPHYVSLTPYMNRLYGTTPSGGTDGGGVVFEVRKAK